MATDLADNATKEELIAFAENAAQQVEEDRKGTEPEKTDGQKIAADHDETPIAETKSGDDEPVSEPDEKTGDSEGQATDDWLDDDLKAEVAAYGISEEELADFTSREELERALRFFDRTALETGRKAMAESQARDEKTGRFTKTEPEPESKPEAKEGQYEVTLDDAYDEGIVAEFTRMRDHYESRLDALETRFSEAETRFMEADALAEERHFDSVVDSLGHADLFGTTGKENAKQLERRQDLMVAVKAQQLGLQQLGREVDLDKSLVNRVARMVFAEDLGKKELKARTKKLSKQSDGRMGGDTSKPPDAPMSLEEEMEQLYKELEAKSGSR